MGAEGSRENVRPALWWCYLCQQNECGLGWVGEAVTQAELPPFGAIHTLQVSLVLTAWKGRAWWYGRETDRMSGLSAWRLPSPVWRRSGARCRLPSVCGSACMLGERPSWWQPAGSTPEPRQRTLRGNEASISHRRTGPGPQVNARFRDTGVELRSSLIGAMRPVLATDILWQFCPL